MSNPYMVQIPFCNTGNKNTIQLTQQAGQDPEDATYQDGFPPVTMLNEDAGGLPPKGLDFNGIFYELSSPIAHYCRGDRIQFDATYAAAIGGYAKGWVVASNDYQKDYISLVDNNLADPNGTNTTWAVYAGQGSVPVATSTTTGTVKLVNSLASTATDAALTAAQGNTLNSQKLDANLAIGQNQTWQNVASQRHSGVSYTNTTGRPIQVHFGGGKGTGNYAEFYVNGSLFAQWGGTESDEAYVSLIIPNGSSYGYVNQPTFNYTFFELR